MEIPDYGKHKCFFIFVLTITAWKDEKNILYRGQSNVYKDVVA